MTSFLDLHNNPYTARKFSRFVSEKVDCVVVSSYCQPLTPFFPTLGVAPAPEILDEFFWARLARLKFYENDFQRLKHAKSLGRYFAAGLSDNNFSKMPKNVFSRFFFATHARKLAQLELISPVVGAVEDLSQTDSLGQKMLRFSAPSKRKRVAYLEPRVREYDEGHIGLSELGRLFLSRNLLDRVYFDQVSRGSVFHETEQLFYAQTFGFGVTLGEIKFPRHKYF